ncbi:MAG: tRNA epoxyqueuosine(34) reductase QueG [bacterium]|nr:tRNA epoxyqueuosine(34) reductase QueG [bacterium]
MTLEERIKSRGRELGFDLVGITAAAGSSDLLPGWVERAGRGEGACSIVAVAMNYHTGGSSPPPGGGLQPSGGLLPDGDLPPSGDLRGRIARYAVGDDYHLVMEARLRPLSGFLRDCGATLARYQVDAGPLFERAIAQRAGLGWRGRHSCLITEQFGTWVVLGEILTDLVLQPDPPAYGDCGSCEACMRGAGACPTGAIVTPSVVDSPSVVGMPGVVDARRCIAYWTIEHRGWIPQEVRPALRDMIFGCDLCQEACPFNRLLDPACAGVRPAVHPEFLPRAETGPRPLLLPLLNIAEDEFRRLFHRSAIRRAKRSGLRRNVAIALGNLGDGRAVPELVRALRDPDDSVVRGHAAWALGRTGGPAAVAALEAARRSEPDARVREEIAAALDM